MFGMIGLELISGSSFLEVLRNLVLEYVPDGERVLKLLSDNAELFLALGIAVGLSQCFFGYAMRKLWTGILSVILCGCFGAAAAVAVFPEPAALSAVTAVAAVLGGAAGYFLRPFFVVAVAVFILFVISGSNVPGIIAGLSAGLVAGVATVAFYRVCLVFYTALAGGMLAGVCISGFVGVTGYPVLLIGGLIAVAGIAVQFVMGRNSKLAAGAGMSAKEAAKRLKATTQMDMAAQLAATDEQDGDGQESPCEAGTADGTVPSGEDFTRPQEEKTEEALPAKTGENGEAAGVCPACGTPYSERAKFCMQCGLKL